MVSGPRLSLIAVATLATVTDGPAAPTVTAPAAELSPAAVVMVVAGNGAVLGTGFRPGVSATELPLPIAPSVAAVADGSFAVSSTCAVWKVRAGVAVPLAGNGTCGFAGDGGPASTARLEHPGALATTPDGGLLIADGNRVRRVDADGRISTVAGNGAETLDGDGGPAVSAGLGGIEQIAAAPDGGFLIAGSERVRRVDPAGVITTVAGTGESGFAGDGGPATRARLTFGGGYTLYGGGLAALPSGGFLVADTGNHRVREVDPAGTIRTVAGTGRDEHGGDGGPAIRARLLAPASLLVNADGSYLIGTHGVIRRVAPDGTISSVAGEARDGWILSGIGTAIFDGDGLAPRHAAINASALARAADGALLIATGDDARVLAITSPTTSLPAVAIVRTRVTPTRVQLRLVATTRGVVHVALSSRSHAGPSTDVPIGPARTTVELSRPRASGVYRVQASVGAATSTVGLLVGPLATRTAHGAIYRYANATQLSNGHIRGCHRFAPRRVDCMNAADDESCMFMTAVRVGASGLVDLRNYPCPRYRRHPRWWRIDGTYPPFGRPGVLPGPLLGPIY